ncbi:protein of unknown function (DUF4706) [Popillia japonica]|uniref:DUF4706 domain-containing protein n=1 Tax=Popillia japonica TaxID=7064 RepID=A0AAW1K255_POPJA
MALKEIADEYFSSINPLASRIYSDLNETKSSYEDIWGSLTEEEKSQIMNETIMKPEICLKYNKKPQRISQGNKPATDKNLSKTPTIENKPKEIKPPLLIQFKTEGDISDKRNQETVLLNIPKTGLDLLDNW